MLAQRYSAKWVFAIFYAVSTLGTLITPLAARMHFGVLIAVRAIVGLGSVSTHMSRGHIKYDSTIFDCVFELR